MKTEISIDEVGGKTLERVVFQTFGPQALLVFTDGTFTTLGIEMGYDPGDETIAPGKLDVIGFGGGGLVANGIMEQAEVDAFWHDLRAAQESANAERERQMFERLKKKFGEE